MSTTVLSVGEELLSLRECVARSFHNASRNHLKLLPLVQLARGGGEEIEYEREREREE